MKLAATAILGSQQVEGDPGMLPGGSDHGPVLRFFLAGGWRVEDELDSLARGVGFRGMFPEEVDEVPQVELTCLEGIDPDGA